MKFVLGRIENIVGNRENAGSQHFPPVFSKAFTFRVVEGRDCVVKSSEKLQQNFTENKSPTIM